MVDYLCDIGAFSKSIFAHAYIVFNISGLPGPNDRSRTSVHRLKTVKVSPNIHDSLPVLFP